MIILNFCTNSNSYVENFKKIFSDVLSWLISGKIICPVCGSEVAYNSTYSRHFKDAHGTRTDTKIVQVICTSCKKTHALIPDFLVPYKHYDAQTIEASVSLDINESDCNVDNSTIYRWKRQFARSGRRALFQLALLFFEVYKSFVSVIKLRNLTLINQLALYAAQLGANSCATVIGSVNVILTHANAGFI